MNKSKSIERKKRREDFWERNRKTNGYLLKKKTGEVLYRVIRALLLFGLCFLILQPIINKVSVSFMKEEDLYDATVINIPRNWTLGNYSLTSSNYIMNYWEGLWNSLWISFVVAILQVASATLVGYGFARFKFPLKKFWFACVILLIIIPPQTIMSPLYTYFSHFDIFGIFKLTTGEALNLKKYIAPYLMMCATCMGLKSGLYIYLLRQYFRGIPKELEEAAYVDGCGNLKTFVRIMLPDAKAMITSCFLFAFVWQWTDSFYSKLFLGTKHLLARALSGIAGKVDGYYLSVLQQSQAPMGVQQQLIATGMLMSIIPLIILYLFAQKGFVESLSQTGIKM